MNSRVSLASILFREGRKWSQKLGKETGGDEERDG